MNVLAVSFFLYLLFPVIDESQPWFEKVLVNPPLSESEKFIKKQELVQFLTAPKFVSTKEEESLLEESSEMLLLNSRNELSLLQVQDEQLSLEHLPNGSRESITVNSSQIVRREYDDLLRLASVIVWKNARSASEVLLLSRENYIYSQGEESHLIRKEVFYYDASQNVFSSCVTEYDANKNPIREVRKGETESVITRTFDYDGRLVSQEEVFTLKGKSTVKRFEYTYTSFSEPNMSYFEDGILRMTQEYEGNSRWRQTVFFDGGFSVVTLYEDFVKVEEHFVEGGN